MHQLQRVHQHHHPEPTQQHRQGHPQRERFAEAQPGQKRRERRVQVLQHRGWSQRQSRQGAEHTEQGDRADDTPPDQHPAALAPGGDPRLLQQPGAQGQADDRTGQHHLRHRDPMPHLLDAQTHQGEGEAAQQHPQRRRRTAVRMASWLRGHGPGEERRSLHSPTPTDRVFPFARERLP